MSLRCLFHIHTRFSFDSWLSPQKIISRARESRADVLIVTDHNTLRGSKEVMKIAEGNPPHMIVAGEYKTEKGDIIGLFLNEEIETRQSDDVIREIKRQGGLVVLPHPFKGHHLDDVLLNQVDLVETFNARCSPSENALSHELAQRLHKPTLAGCDAHFAAELNAAVTQLEAGLPSNEKQLREALLMAPRSIETVAISKIYQPCSQMIKAFKTRDIFLFFYQVKRMASLLMDAWSFRGMSGK